jgi:hypothetical protein
MIVPRLFRSRRLAITISLCQSEQLSNTLPEANLRKAELPKTLHRWESLAGKTQRWHRVLARVVHAVATEAKSLGAFNPPSFAGASKPQFLEKHRCCETASQIAAARVRCAVVTSVFEGCEGWA